MINNNWTNTDNISKGINALVHSDLEQQINELRLAQIELEKSRNHFSALYELSPISYLTLNDDGIIVECNNALSNLLGIGIEQLKLRRFARLIADQNKEFWNRFWLLSKQSNGIQICELSLMRADLSTVHVKLKCIRKQLEPNTAPVLLINLTDITIYKQVSQELSIVAVAFESQEGMIVTDANKIILRVNQAFSRITGYSSEEALGNPPSFLCSGLHDENFHQSLWVTALSKGYWQGEVWEKRKNGELYPAWLTLTAVFDEDSCVSHYVCSFTDITAQKEAEKILLDARNHMENQVSSTKEELEKVKQKTTEINSALTVLLKHRENDKSQSQLALSREVEETILPFLKKLKNASAGREQSSHLLNVLEMNLIDLVNAYGNKDAVSAGFKQLTPLEVQVASMVRQGLPTKVIAKTLNISDGTVSIHRNHIRKKLGLNKKTDNLQMHLKSLLD